MDEKRSELTDGRNQRKRKVRAEVSSHHVGVIFFLEIRGATIQKMIKWFSVILVVLLAAQLPASDAAVSSIYAVS